MAGCVAADDFQSYRVATRDLQLDHEDVGLASNMRMIPIRVHLNQEPAIQMPITPLTNGTISIHSCGSQCKWLRADSLG